MFLILLLSIESRTPYLSVWANYLRKKGLQYSLEGRFVVVVELRNKTQVEYPLADTFTSFVFEVKVNLFTFFLLSKSIFKKFWMNFNLKLCRKLSGKSNIFQNFAKQSSVLRAFFGISIVFVHMKKCIHLPKKWLFLSFPCWRNILNKHSLWTHQKVNVRFRVYLINSNNLGLHVKNREINKFVSPPELYFSCIIIEHWIVWSVYVVEIVLFLERREYSRAQKYQALDWWMLVPWFGNSDRKSV